MQSSARDLIRGLQVILQGFPQIAAAWLFGSAARGEMREDSDVDVGLVFVDRKATALDQHRLLGDLVSRLEAATAPHAVDLVVLEAQGPVFAHDVLLEGVQIIDADPARRAQFVADTIVRALDFRPTWMLAAQGQVDGLRRWLKGQAG